MVILLMQIESVPHESRPSRQGKGSSCKKILNTVSIRFDLHGRLLCYGSPVAHLGLYPASHLQVKNKF